MRTVVILLSISLPCLAQEMPHLPGMMTGMILAMARGAGEVAPLLLVGVKDLAPALPVDGVFPFVHPQRSFMHLAYQIYVVGFKSPNAEAAKPMVFTTTCCSSPSWRF